jgi:clan AA aspartic protease (TIGR02281 family)
MKKFASGIINLCFFLVFSALSPAGDIFRWVDENGVIHFTDNLHNIPEKSRPGSERIKTPDRPPELALPEPLDKVSVPIQKQGEVVIVQATVNQRVAVKFVVDTGASYTLISRDTAKQLGIDMEQKLPTIPFQTANGTIQAPLINLESIEVGGMQMKDLTAAVHDVFPDSNVAGLLGLNFLSHFRMDIDKDNGVLVLEKR